MRIGLLAGLVVLCTTAVVVVKAVNRKPRTNILVVMTDDQTLEQLRVMKGVRTFVQAEGTTFLRNYVTTPSSSSARAGFLTGRFAHNNGIRDDEEPKGGATGFAATAGATLPVALHEAGYYTAAIGSYLPGWGARAAGSGAAGARAAGSGAAGAGAAGSGVAGSGPSSAAPPAGWDHWYGLIDPSTHSTSNYRVSNDGVEQTFGATAADYQTDVLGKAVGGSIGTANDSGRPWFVMWTPSVPHGPDALDSSGSSATTAAGSNGQTAVQPAARHAGTFANEPLYQSSNLTFGASAPAAAEANGKPNAVVKRVTAAPADTAKVLPSYRAELESLQAVDEWINLILVQLDTLGVLDHTDIFFTSDGGSFHGEHGLTGSGLLYEPAVHVPLVARGPDFAKGALVNQLTVNLDLTATVARIAGAELADLDGRDLRPLGGDPQTGANRGILLEQWYGSTESWTRQLRLADWAYATWSTGETELYDLAQDPFQLANRAHDPAFAPVIGELAPRLDALATCAGPACEDSDLARRR